VSPLQAHTAIANENMQPTLLAVVSNNENLKGKNCVITLGNGGGFYSSRVTQYWLLDELDLATVVPLTPQVRTPNIQARTKSHVHHACLGLWGNEVTHNRAWGQIGSATLKETRTESNEPSTSESAPSMSNATPLAVSTKADDMKRKMHVTMLLERYALPDGFKSLVPIILSSRLVKECKPDVKFQGHSKTITLQAAYRQREFEMLLVEKVVSFSQRLKTISARVRSQKFTL
jgi:hypothetical protein